MKNKIIKLTPNEQDICKLMVERVQNNNARLGIRHDHIGKQSQYETDLEGFGAEFAFCKLFNIMPDLTISARGRDNDWGDAILPNRMTVDIKATKYPNGKLIACIWKSERKIKPDLHALMIGQFPVYRFAGFARTKELFEEGNISDLGYGDVYAIDQERLLDYKQL